MSVTLIGLLLGPCSNSHFMSNLDRQVNQTLNVDLQVDLRIGGNFAALRLRPPLSRGEAYTLF